MIEAMKVEDAVKDSLYREEELVVSDDESLDGLAPEGAIFVEGVMTTFGFHPDRLETHREEVRDWLSQLDDNFMKDKGGGWSFTQVPFTKSGEQWGEQRDAQNLLVLGEGLGLVKNQMPREIWEALPGGMPYYSINLEEEE